MILQKNPLKSQAKLFVTSGIVLSSLVLSSVPTVAAGPWRLTQTFLSPNSENFGSFGQSLSISGNNVLIGARFDNTGAREAGAAYLFDGLTGNRLQTFLHPTLESYSEFGSSVSISGNNVLIGAPYDVTQENQAGAAYLFDGATGSLLQTFLHPTLENFSAFGFSVSISGNNVLIVAPGENAKAEGAGVAYLFDAVTGNLLQTFSNPTPEYFDGFGYSVAISGNNVLIAQVNNLGAEDEVAAYLFDAATGNLLQTFSNPTPELSNLFASSLAISENNVLIRPGNGEAAYLFDAATGNSLQTFSKPNSGISGALGYSVAISGNNALIGGAENGTGVAYLFDATTGSLLQTFRRPSPGINDFFGFSLSISGNNVLIGGSQNGAGAAYLYKPIPEPFTILGAGSAAVLGCFYKRRLAKKQ